ncbi:MAG: hypothetical protein ACLP59_07710 [Bryobacteraceae bacterium]
MSQYAVLITWRDLTGTEPTMAMLEESLSRFRLSAVLLGITRIAAHLKTWQNEPDFEADRQLARKFLPTYFPGIRVICAQDANRVTFTRLGLLFVVKQACRVCKLDGKNVENDAEVEEILSCCLMANDLLLGRLPQPTDTAIDKAANLLPFANYIPRNSYPMDLARNLLIMEEVAPRLADRRDYIDLAALFRTATGLTPRDFCQLAFASSIRFITNLKAQINDPATGFLLTPQYFRHSAAAPEAIRSFFDRMSTTPAALQTEAQRDSLGADFLALQRHPLVQYDADAYVCPDAGFLLDKAGPALYWTLHQATRSSSDLLAYWAAVIDRYVHWLFEQAYRGRGHWQPSARFANGDEAADLCLVEGSDLVLLEVKASTLTVKAKYGFAADALLAELQAKAITGTGERKGVAQLRHNISRFLEGDEIAGVERAKVRTIYPVLVFLDHSFTGPYVNLVYNERFDSADLRRRHRKTITRLFSLTVHDLENVLPHTDRHGFTDILESFYRANRKIGSELSQSSVPLLLGEDPGHDPVRERFEQFGTDLERALFSSPGDQDS